MSIFETFSKRQAKHERAGQTDVYQYDDLPETLRTQIYLILRDTLGQDYKRVVGRNNYGSELWVELHDQMCRELGVLNLDDNARLGAQEKCKTFLLRAPTSEAIDFIEMAFWVVAQLPNLTDHAATPGVQMEPEEAIEELNDRFKEHCVGYQFEGSEIVRVDSQYLHAEAVKPAISLLNSAGFDGALEEFLNAHEHYRKGKMKEAMSNALNAFESTMKAICYKNDWSYKEGDTASTLVKTVLENGLVPRYKEKHIAGLRNTLEAGVPTLRNKNSGHGQGLFVKQVSDHFVGHTLHLAAANIVFLVEAHEARNRK